MGVAFAYLFMQPSIVKCPRTTAAGSLKEAEPQKECNCDVVLAAAMRKHAAEAETATVSLQTTSDAANSQEKDFYAIGLKLGTDKVAGKHRLPGCLDNPSTCTRPGCVKKECRSW